MDTTQIPLKQAPSALPFRTYFFKEQKVYNIIILSCVAVQFMAFKVLYPFPDFFSDSYSYLFAAYAHLDVNIWPIGYSKFLALFHTLTHSAVALNFFQYLSIEAAALYFYQTVVYHFPTGRYTRIGLCIFLFFNPLNLYLANYVSSDALFISLSLLWITELIWIIKRATWTSLLVLTMAFSIAFTFRYNAAYYPLVAAVAFVVCRANLWYKLAGIWAGPALAMLFVVFSLKASEKLLGSPQFPPVLGGWQWGNNALYFREYIEEDSTHFPTKETAELDAIARDFFRTVPAEKRALASYVANFFIRQPDAPLKQYLVRHYKMETDSAQVIAWGKAAIVFDTYGRYLIKRHPWAYMRYYLLVNSKNYFFPPLEKLEVYNLGRDQIAVIAAWWFDMHSTAVHCVSAPLQGLLLSFFPALFCALNLYLCYGIWLGWRRGLLKKARDPLLKCLALLTLFLSLNCLFSIFANIIVIRYEVFPMVIALCTGALATDYAELSRMGQLNKVQKGEVADHKPLPAF